MNDLLFQPYPIPTNRDILLFQLDNNQIMVVASEASGGVGPKPLDKINVDGYTIGRFSARVALMEILSVGATPFCLVDTLSVEMNPTGKEIIKGVISSAKEANMNPDFAITGGTENNFQIEQTGIGITALGFVNQTLLRVGTSKKGDTIMALGTPCVGYEVLKGEKTGTISDLTDLLKLNKLKIIHEIISVGSEGILHEIDVLAKSSNLNYKINRNLTIDTKKSAGPGTVILFTTPEYNLDNLEKNFKKPLQMLGQMI